MSLTQGYGVVIGTLSRHFIEEPDEEGRWPHYHIYVNTPGGEYQCVINLKSRTAIKIQYRDFRNVGRSYFENVLSMADGFHTLDSIPTSGALDAIRHPGLKNPGCRCGILGSPLLAFGYKRRCQCTRWWLENGTDVIELIQYYLLNVGRIYIFGEPYAESLGLHNVHMNQGDPISSPFSSENGIWQDGGTILEYYVPEPRLSVFLTKFQTQSLRTDESGHPA